MTPKIDALQQKLAALEAQVGLPGTPIYVLAQIAQCQRRLRWHLLRTPQHRAHQNIGTTTLMGTGRPRARKTVTETPDLPLAVEL